MTSRVRKASAAISSETPLLSAIVADHRSIRLPRNGWAIRAIASASGSRDFWNANHVDEGYDPAFLDCLEWLVLTMETA